MLKTALKICVNIMETKVSIPFVDERQAEVAYNSLRVEVEPARSRVRRSLTVSGRSLVASFVAEDARSLRVSLNSFFEHVVLIANTIQHFG